MTQEREENTPGIQLKREYVRERENPVTESTSGIWIEAEVLLQTWTLETSILVSTAFVDSGSHSHTYKPRERERERDVRCKFAGPCEWQTFDWRGQVLLDCQSDLFLWMVHFFSPCILFELSQVAV